MKNYKSYVLLSLFCAEFVKTVLLPASFVDAALLTVLGSVFAFFEYKNYDKELKALENSYKAQQEDLDRIKEQVSSIKIIQHVKPNSLGFK